VNNLSHDEAYSELTAVALDIVPAELGAAVREHAAGCPECGPELGAIEETVAELAQLVPQRAMNLGHGAGIRSRLVMRARGEREGRFAEPGQPDPARGVASLTGLGHRLTPRTQRAVEVEAKKSLTPRKQRPAFFSWSNFLAFAASLAFVVAAVQLVRVTSDRNALRAQLGSRPTVPASREMVKTSASEREALVAAMAGPDVKIVPLSSKSATRMGRMFWNPSSNDWTMVVYTMGPPKPGMTYQVWLITDSTKISAGTFQPDSTGHAFMQAKYALDRNALKAVAVTEEPAGGMPSPTGPIIVSGSATQ
jgi:anti-sigma-K factor RskA